MSWRKQGWVWLAGNLALHVFAFLVVSVTGIRQGERTPTPFEKVEGICFGQPNIIKLHTMQSRVSTVQNIIMEGQKVHMYSNKSLVSRRVQIDSSYTFGQKLFLALSSNPNPVQRGVRTGGVCEGRWAVCFPACLLTLDSCRSRTEALLQFAGDVLTLFQLPVQRVGPAEVAVSIHNRLLCLCAVEVPWLHRITLAMAPVTCVRIVGVMSSTVWQLDLQRCCH